MITNDKIKSIIDECKESRFGVTTRDIAYILLCKYIDDKVAYKCVFGADRQFDANRHNDYKNSSAMSMLKQLVDAAVGQELAFDRNGDITFEENKAYMLKLKKDTEDAIENNEIDKKDGLKILADLSVKLNDKFQVREERIEQVVHVFTKFNAVCQCGREIYIPTKQDLMKKYNLIEKQ